MEEHLLSNRPSIIVNRFSLIRWSLAYVFLLFYHIQNIYTTQEWLDSLDPTKTPPCYKYSPESLSLPKAHAEDFILIGDSALIHHSSKRLANHV